MQDPVEAAKLVIHYNRVDFVPANRLKPLGGREMVGGQYRATFVAVAASDVRVVLRVPRASMMFQDVLKDVAIHKYVF